MDEEVNAVYIQILDGGLAKNNPSNADSGFSMAKKNNSQELKFTSQAFTLVIDVFPPIVMAAQNALKFAADLATHQELTDVHMSDESWTFSRPQTKGMSRTRLEVSVKEQEVTIEQRAPAGLLERFELLVDQIINSVDAVFSPKAILGSVVSLEYVVDLESDARQKILGNLDMLGEDDDDDGKIGIFERPCHFVGLRLGFPAFEYQDSDENDEESNEVVSPVQKEAPESKQDEQEPAKKIDWHATLTLQSQPDDPQAVSVEVTGRWIGPVKWKDLSKSIIERVKKVDEFLKTKTRDFLQQFRSE